MGQIVESAIVVEDPGVVALGLESISRGLCGHLPDDGEYAAFDAGDEMPDVSIGAVDHVFAFDGSSWGHDFVVVIASADL